MTRIKWNRDAEKLYVPGQREFNVSCKIRNELNGLRALGKKSDVVYAVVDGRTGPPYMPRPFPKGIWKITGIEIIADKTSPFYPVKIKTNATQTVESWALDPKTGGYKEPTGMKVIDGGYHLHFATYTLGCGAISSIAEALRLASVLWDLDAEIEVV